MSNDLECGCEDECMHKPDCVFERKKPAVMSEQREFDCPSCGYISSSINDEIVFLRAQIASARKALEGVYDHMDRNGMASWPVAKRVRKELDSLTDENGK